MKDILFSTKKNKNKPKLLYSSFMFWSVLLLFFLHVFPLFFFSSLSSNFYFADITKSAIIELTNKERVNSGLTELKENDLLNQAAKEKAQHMLSEKYFDHYSPSGVSPWHFFEENGYDYEYAGENLAIGFVEPEEVYTAWQESYTHHENLLNKNYKEIGIGIAKGNFNGNYTTIVVQLFGTTEETSSTTPIAELPEIKKVAGATNIEKETTEFFVMNYNNMIRVIVAILALLILISFLTVIMKGIKHQYKKVLLKAVVYILALILMFYLEKGKIISVIPHNIMIQ